MTRTALALAVLLSLIHSSARAAEKDSAAVIRGCITAAAQAHRLPPVILVVLLRVEGGSLGAVSSNTNATVDIGPMQVNQIWIPEVAAHWRASRADTYTALRDSFCANIEAGAWILRRALDEAGGDFWEGVSFYHSHKPEHKARYLQQVLKQALALQEQAVRSAAASSRPATVLASR